MQGIGIILILTNGKKCYVKKFVKLIDYTYAFNILTTFEYEGRTMTGNGSYVNLVIFFCKKIVKSHQVGIHTSRVQDIGIILIKKNGGNIQSCFIPY